MSLYQYVSILLFLVAKETQNTLPIIVGMGVPLLVLLLIVIVAVAIILIRKRLQFIAGVRMGVSVLQNNMHIYYMERNSADIVLTCSKYTYLIGLWVLNVLQLYVRNTSVCHTQQPFCPSSATSFSFDGSCIYVVATTMH